MIQALIPVLAPIVGKVIGNLFPDPTEKAKAEAEACDNCLLTKQKLNQLPRRSFKLKPHQLIGLLQIGDL